MIHSEQFYLRFISFRPIISIKILFIFMQDFNSIYHNINFPFIILSFNRIEIILSLNGPSPKHFLDLWRVLLIWSCWKAQNGNEPVFISMTFCDSVKTLTALKSIICSICNMIIRLIYFLELYPKNMFNWAYLKDAKCSWLKCKIFCHFWRIISSTWPVRSNQCIHHFIMPLFIHFFIWRQLPSLK